MDDNRDIEILLMVHVLISFCLRMKPILVSMAAKYFVNVGYSLHVTSLFHCAFSYLWLIIHTGVEQYTPFIFRFLKLCCEGSCSLYYMICFLWIAFKGNCWHSMKVMNEAFDIRSKRTCLITKLSVCHADKVFVFFFIVSIEAGIESNR